MLATPFRFLILTSLLVCLIGCGGSRIYPVEGTIVYADGTPAGKELAGYQVTFESVEKKIGASGMVTEEGTFQLSTEKPNDGALMGKHKVAITAPIEDVADRPPAKYLLAEKFKKLDSSGLEVTIENKKNQITLKVEK